MNKSIIILVALLIVSSFYQACAQSTPEIIADNIDFCNANLEESLIPELIVEFHELENYFIRNGLLKDSSGSSYLSVYKQIAKEGDLKFITNLQLKTMEASNFSILRSCSFKLLSQKELTELTPRHIALSLQINDEVGNDVNLREIALSITENLTAKDFDLQYYKLSSLLSFYALSKAYEIDSSLTPTIDFNKIENRLFIELSTKDELSVSGVTSSMVEVKTLILEFIASDINAKAIEITAANNASYESYTKLLDLVNDLYTDVRNKKSIQVFGKSLSELSKGELETIKQQVPKNVIYNKPK